MNMSMPNKSTPPQLWEPTRRHSRVKAVLPVQVGGNDAFGNAFQEIAHTLDISRTGARLGAIRRRLKIQDVLTLHYRNRKMEFRVVWIRQLEASGEFQVGLQAAGNQGAFSHALGLQEHSPSIGHSAAPPESSRREEIRV